MSYRDTKSYDVLAAAPLIILYGLGIGIRLGPDAMLRAGQLPSPSAILALSKDIADIGYFGTIIALVFLRRMPIGKSTGPWTRLLALTSAYMSLGRPLLPPSLLPRSLDVLSVIMTVIGSVTSVIVLVWLGRSFSVLPEARRLVTTGPYRIVRHPLYLTEEIGNLGVMLQFAQPWSLMIEIVNVSLQLWRMSAEERVLVRFFPGYADYAARTRRVLPGIY